MQIVDLRRLRQSSKPPALSLYRYFLPSNLQASCFTRTAHPDLQFELAADFLAALDANQCVRDYFKAFQRYLRSTDSAAFGFRLHSVSSVLDTDLFATYEKN